MLNRWHARAFLLADAPDLGRWLLTVRIAYASGFSHRLCLETPQPPPSGNALKHLLHELARRPADVFAEATVPAAESLLRGIARRHGAWRAWKDEAAYLQWLVRSRNEVG